MSPGRLADVADGNRRHRAKVATPPVPVKSRKRRAILPAMTPNHVKQRIRAGKASFGSLLNFGDPLLACSPTSATS